MKNDVAELKNIRGANSVVGMRNGNTVEILKVGTLTIPTVVEKEV